MSGQDEELVMIRKIVKDGLFGHAWFGNRLWHLLDVDEIYNFR